MNTKIENKRGGAIALAMTFLTGIFLMIGSNVTFAQVYSPQTLGTTVLVTTSTNYAVAPTNGAGVLVMDVRYQRTTGIEILPSAAAQVTNTLVLQPSLDGINYETNSAAAITLTAISQAGLLSPNHFILTNRNCGYWRLASGTTTLTGTTNLIKYGITPGVVQ